jgi:hypothetical protein
MITSTVCIILVRFSSNLVPLAFIKILPCDSYRIRAGGAGFAAGLMYTL